MLKQFPLVHRNPSQGEATKMQRSGLFREAVNLLHLGGKHFGILIALYHLNFHRCVAQSYALWHHDLHLELQLTRSMLMFAMSEVRALASGFAFGAATHTLNAAVSHADRCFLPICQTHAFKTMPSASLENGYWCMLARWLHA